MRHARRPARITAIFLAIAVLVMGGAGVAAAAGLVVSATSPNGQAYGSTNIYFDNENVVRWGDIYLNDRCNPNTPGEGDGVRAKMNLYIRQYGNTILVGSREDVGGCGSAPYTGSAYWVSNGPIDRGGMSVCSKGGCSAIKWVVRP